MEGTDGGVALFPCSPPRCCCYPSGFFSFQSPTAFRGLTCVRLPRPLLPGSESVLRPPS